MKTLADYELVLSLYQSGMTQNEVANKIGRSQHYVSKRLIAAGVTRSKKETYAIKAKPFVPSQEIVDLYVSGLSSVEVAAKIKRSHGYVLRHVRAAGAVRSKGESLRIIAERTAPTLRVASNGYLVYSRRGSDKLLHRSVMESVLGRKLGKHEVVHHKNGNRLDNRPENLELLASQSDHARHHNPRSGALCLICGSPAKARTLCNKHHQAIRSAGQLHLYPKQSVR